MGGVVWAMLVGGIGKRAVWVFGLRWKGKKRMGKLEKAEKEATLSHLTSLTHPQRLASCLACFKQWMNRQGAIKSGRQQEGSSCFSIPGPLPLSCSLTETLSRLKCSVSRCVLSRGSVRSLPSVEEPELRNKKLKCRQVLDVRIVVSSRYRWCQTTAIPLRNVLWDVRLKNEVWSQIFW